ncbi:MAG: YceI family protein [Actinomycetota bacterium]|nr:YceI family protein [Actinomycetota bacterium]
MSVTSSGTTLLREHEGRHVPHPGTYRLDPSHSTVEFVSRHLMIARVRGRFADFTADLRIGETPEDSSVEAVIQAASIDTGDDKRDEHLRSPDFFDVEHYPAISFHSTGIEPGAGDTWRVTGDLTVRDVTRLVQLEVSFEGATVDPWGNERIAFTASTEVDREEWGLTWNVALESGGVLVGRKVRLELAVEATRVS